MSATSNPESRVSSWEVQCRVRVLADLPQDDLDYFLDWYVRKKTLDVDVFKYSRGSFHSWDIEWAMWEIN